MEAQVTARVRVSANRPRQYSTSFSEAEWKSTLALEQLDYQLMLKNKEDI